MRPGVDDAIDEAVRDGIPFVVTGVVTRDGSHRLHVAGDAHEDTVLALHSVTKTFTTTAALQCVEDGLIDLDAPARDYLPAIGELDVLVSLAEDGTARTRPPARDITPRMLLRHTAGLGYDMFDPRLAALTRARPTSDAPLRDALRTPLLHDPGDRWTYGTATDWLGLVIAAVRGARLEDVFRERIYTPCGMQSTSFDISPGMRRRLSPLHRRTRDGHIVASATTPPDSPEIDMGGQGLFSTVPDLLTLLRVWLGDGSAPGGRVLRPETVAQAVRAVPGIEVRPLTTAIPALACDVDHFPGRPRSWASSFLINDEEVPGGRRSGSLTWSGLANVHFWIDRSAGIAAVWATQLLPFFDPAVMRAVERFERAVYAEA